MIVPSREQIEQWAIDAGATLYADTLCVNGKDADGIVERIACQAYEAGVTGLQHENALSAFLAATGLSSTECYTDAYRSFSRGFDAAWASRESKIQEQALQIDELNSKIKMMRPYNGRAMSVQEHDEVVATGKMVLRKLMAALEEIITISDRDHEAWNNAKTIISEIKEEEQPCPPNPPI